MLPAVIAMSAALISRENMGDIKFQNSNSVQFIQEKKERHSFVPFQIKIIIFIQNSILSVEVCQSFGRVVEIDLKMNLGVSISAKDF